MKIYRCIIPTVIKSVQTGLSYKINKYDLIKFKVFSRDRAIIEWENGTFSMDKSLFNEKRFIKE